MTIAAYLTLLAAAPAGAGDPCSTATLRSSPAACEKAIAAETSSAAKAELYFQRAYAMDELHRPTEAVADSGRALALDPDNPKFLHERAFALGEIAEFDAAIRDLDREVALRPDSVDAHRERSFALLATARFEGAYRDAARVAELDPKVPDAHLLVSERALWAGRFDEASREAELARTLAQGTTDAKLSKRIERQRSAVALWRSKAGAPGAAQRCKKAFEAGAVTEPATIGDCTSAYLSAPTNAKKAEYLTYRSVAWSAGQQDPGRWLVDAEVAAALDPTNPDWQLNVAGIYNSLGRPHAALPHIDRALAVKPSFAAFATRAAVRYDLGDKDGAFADGKKSFELRPNEIALVVLGDLARDRKDDKSAKLYWMGAWHLGEHDDDLKARLKRVGVEDPDKEPKS